MRSKKLVKGFEAWWRKWSTSEYCQIDDYLSLGQQGYLVSVCKLAFAAGVAFSRNSKKELKNRRKSWQS